MKLDFGDIFNMGFVLGYLLKDPHLSQNMNDEETYYCAFNIATRRQNGNHVIISAFMEGDMAYTFANQYHKYDTLLFVYENMHIYSGAEYSTNRARVISYAAYTELPSGFEPIVDDDELAFIQKCRELYRNSAPLPSENEVYVWKAVQKKWSKKKWKYNIPKDDGKK